MSEQQSFRFGHAKLIPVMLFHQRKDKSVQRFQEKEFVVFDVETTGLSPASGDRIIEIAALKVKNFKPVERFHSMVNPQRLISFAAFEVNGISDRMLVGAPKCSEILPDFLHFLGQATLIGHNVQFDLNFLYNELNLAQIKLDRQIDFIDTIRLARQIMPRLKRYPLWLVADALGIQESQKHRAMADVDLTFEVFYRLIHKAHEENRLKDLCI
jgi:DNA polymerase III epsilon subunit